MTLPSLGGGGHLFEVFLIGGGRFFLGRWGFPTRHEWARARVVFFFFPVIGIFRIAPPILFHHEQAPFYIYYFSRDDGGNMGRKEG